jgi:hypothetical protein
VVAAPPRDQIVIQIIAGPTGLLVPKLVVEEQHLAITPVLAAHRQLRVTFKPVQPQRLYLQDSQLLHLVQEEIVVQAHPGEIGVVVVRIATVHLVSKKDMIIVVIDRLRAVLVVAVAVIAAGEDGQAAHVPLVNNTEVTTVDIRNGEVVQILTVVMTIMSAMMRATGVPGARVALHATGHVPELAKIKPNLRHVM